MTNRLAEISERVNRMNGILVPISYLGLPTADDGTHLDRGDGDNTLDYKTVTGDIWMEVLGITEGDPEEKYLEVVAFMSGANSYKPRKGDKMTIDGTTFTMAIVQAFGVPITDYKLTGRKKVG